MKKYVQIFMLTLTWGHLSAQSLLWAKGMGGTIMDRAYDIAVDALGNSYTTGHFSGTADFDPGPGVYNLTAVEGRDIFISKLDPNGNFLWAKSIGGNYSYVGLASDEGCSIAIDDYGYVYATGSFSGTADFDPGAGSFMLSSYPGWTAMRDIFILKLDVNGNFVWAKGIGGAGDDVGEALTVDPRGNVYITGAYRDTVDFDAGPATFTLGSANIETPFVMKIDINGNLAWAKSLAIAGGSPNSYGSARGIVCDHKNNVGITGWYKGILDFDPGPASYTLSSQPYLFGVGASIPSVDIFVMKLDTGGNFVWAKSIGAIDYYPEYGKAIAADTMGSLYTTGFFVDTVDFDPGPGSYILDKPGAFVLKLDAAGNFAWARYVGEPGSTTGCDVMTDPAGNVYTSGTFIGTIDFDPGPSTYTLISRNVNSVSDANAYLLKLDPAGNFVWVMNMAATAFFDGNDRNAIAMDSYGSIYMAGHYTDTCDFDPGVGTYTLNSAGGYDIFVSKLGQGLIAGISAITEQPGFIVYPNPASDHLVIRASREQQNQPYQLIDQTGRIVSSGKLQGNSTTIEVSTLAPGLYFLKIEHLQHPPIKIVKQ